MSEPLEEFREVMRRLRAECPWKRSQTHRSLVRYLLEEAHETAEAIETGTPADLRDELGDLLLQVYFHAAIAEEAGEFTLDDVAAGVVAKMRRRNPHVFGDAEVAADPVAVNELWESVKAGERDRREVTDGIAASLPALLYAAKVLDRLARAGRSAGPDDEEPLLLLVPSPLLGPATWGPVAWWLRGSGRDVVVADPARHPATPDGVVAAVVAAAAGRPVVLVVHSNAGLYPAHLATLLDVRATVYVDAALPAAGRAGGATPLAPPGLLDRVRGLADAAGVLPPWTDWWDDATVARLFPEAATRAAVEAEQRRLPLVYLTSTVPVPAGWTTAPAAYLALGETYADEREQATAHGWPTQTLSGGHLHLLVDPAAVGSAVLDLLARALDRPPVEALGDRLLGLVARANDRGVDPEQALRDAVRRRLASSAS